MQVTRSAGQRVAKALLALVIPVACLVLGARAVSSQIPDAVDEQGPMLFVLPESQTVSVGRPFVLDVYISQAPNLGAFSFDVQFDQEIVRINNVELGPHLGSTGRDTRVFLEQIDNDAGRLYFGAQSEGQQPGPRGLGRLATLRGHARHQGSSDFVLVSAHLTNTNGVSYPPPIDFQSATVLVAAPSSPTSTASPTVTRTPSLTATATPTSTVTPSVAPTLTASPTVTVTDTPVPSPSPSMAPTQTPIAHTMYLPLVFNPLLTNGGFEAGTFVGWEESGELRRRVGAEIARSGRYAALLGDPDYVCENGVPVGEAVITQTVRLPNAPNLRLVLWYRLFSQDASSEDQWREFDRFEVRVNGETRVWRANLDEGFGCDKPPYDSGWSELVVQLDAYRGRMVHVSLATVNHPDMYYNTYTYVDDVAIAW